MNTLAHFAGILGLFYLMILAFAKLESTTIGWALVIVFLWLLVRTLVAAYDDFVDPATGDDE